MSLLYLFETLENKDVSIARCGFLRHRVVNADRATRALRVINLGMKLLDNAFGSALQQSLRPIVAIANAPCAGV
jgi:hypothetical protein